MKFIWMLTGNPLLVGKLNFYKMYFYRTLVPSFYHEKSDTTVTSTILTSDVTLAYILWEKVAKVYKIYDVDNSDIQMLLNIISQSFRDNKIYESHPLFWMEMLNKSFILKLMRCIG